jgi:L-2-hydroxyglutarate oxidase LhgO
MNKKSSCDYLIIGSGILGLSIGIRILRANPNSRVKVLDKESIAGSHASSRNSGVLHSGLYYEPNSLKANFTKIGNESLKKYIRDRDLPLLETGKILVANSDDDVTRLERLIKLADSSGARASLLTENMLEDIEPLAKTHRKFLWSPDTCISSPRHVLNSLVSDFTKLGGDLRLNSEVKSINKSSVELSTGQSIRYSVLINCGGTGALSLANMEGLGRQYRLLPVLGSYLSTDSRELPLRTLVYSVPHPLSPFLGVHFTQSTDGKIKIGPTAIPLLGREQYTLKTRLKFNELSESLGSLSILLSKNPLYASRILVNQVQSGTSRGMIRRSTKLVPSSSRIHSWKREPAGIRAQLIHSQSGKMVDDFVIEKNQNSIHILNAVSPGWTSAFPFADHVVRKLMGLNYSGS